MAKRAKAKAHQDTYRNQPSLDRLPKSGTERDERSSKDPTAGRLDEQRNRPGKATENDK